MPIRPNSPGPCLLHRSLDPCWGSGVSGTEERAPHPLHAGEPKYSASLSVRGVQMSSLVIIRAYRFFTRAAWCFLVNRMDYG